MINYLLSGAFSLVSAGSGRRSGQPGPTPETTTGPPEAATGFNDPDFMRLRTFIQDVREARRAGRTGLRPVKDNVPYFAAIIRAVQALPRLAISVSPSPEGCEMLKLYSRKRWGIIPYGVATAVLSLPADPGDYLRKRRAVRRNAIRARAAGIRCIAVPHGDELRRRIDDWLEAQDNPGEHATLLYRIGRESGEFWIAIDSKDETIAVATLIADGEVATLTYVVSAQHENRSDARHLLSAEMFTDLARRGFGTSLVPARSFFPMGWSISSGCLASSP